MSENKAPEKVEYNGWKLFEKVIICAKPWKRWIGNQWTSDGTLQGYVVEPGNKKQFESAKNWADYTEYGPYNWETRTYEWKKEHPAQVYEFDNSGFTLELLESADGSSQGGKLSFWNCKITKDDKTFVIGIAADLLLDVLKTHTVVNGVVQGPLMFARCKGGVGMLSTDMDSYKEALADMQTKAVMSKGKTSKHKVGKVYGTATLANIYVGDFYIWYEPIYREERGSYSWSNPYKTLVGFKKLSQPKVLKYFPDYRDGKNKLSDYEKKLYVYRLEEKLPKRVELAIEMDMDISREELASNWLKANVIDAYTEYQKDIKKGYRRNFTIYSAEYVGISANSDFYELPDEVKKIIRDAGYTICEN